MAAVDRLDALLGIYLVLKPSVTPVFLRHLTVGTTALGFVKLPILYTSAMSL